MTNCSLIIATYNWPDALNLCLESISIQTLSPMEIIIADDGSTINTKHLIQSWQKKISIPIKHIWHEDEGFQLAKIRNKAIAAADYSYIIQIDGDLILHKDFIKDHIELRKADCFVTGSRVLLSKITSENLIKNTSIDIKAHSINNKNLLNGVRIKLLRKLFKSTYKQSGKNKYYVKGCNMAFWKQSLESVNGYNEDFTGWGREDSELAIRLINSNVKKQFLKMGGICYHIFHKEAERKNETFNTKMMNKAIVEKRVWAENGLSKCV